MGERRLWCVSLANSVTRFTGGRRVIYKSLKETLPTEYPWSIFGTVLGCARLTLGFPVPCCFGLAGCSVPIGTTTFPNQLPEALLSANVGALGVLLGEPTAMRSPIIQRP